MVHSPSIKDRQIHWSASWRSVFSGRRTRAPISTGRAPMPAVQGLPSFSPKAAGVFFFARQEQKDKILV
jgi:hypothetical protein